MTSTTIDDLPNEVLYKISQYLNHSEPQKRILLQVSKRWNAIVDETVGVFKCIGERNVFLAKDQKCSPLSSVMEMGISHCIVSNLHDQDSSLTFCRPFLLQQLEFIGHISPRVFSSILLDQNFIHLKSVSLHVTSLSTIDLNLDAYKETKPPFLETLEDLAIFSDRLISSDLSEFNMEMCFQNMLALLQLQFFSLRSFSLTSPLFLDKEIELFLQMMKFISNHVGILLKLRMNFIYRWSISNASSAERTMEEINAVNDALLGLNETVEVLVPTNLRTLDFSIDDRNCVCPTSLTVRETLLVQKQLRKMVYMCWNYMPIPVDVMRTNAATLTEVRLTVDDLTEPVDGQHFAVLVNLRKLVLEADGEVEFDNIATEAPRLKSASAFPKSLRTVDFRNIFMSVDDAEILAKDFPHLRTLILVNIGRIDSLGMTMSTLLWILRCSPTIRFLKVKGLNSTCFDLWEKGETSGCRYCPKGLHLSPYLCTLVDKVVKSVPKFSSEKATLHPQYLQGPYLRLNPHDRKLMRDLFSTTNMDTKFIPLIEKKRKKWSKV